MYLMNNEITESTLSEYFNGELSRDENDRITAWTEESRKNRELFFEARRRHLHARWGTRASLISADYSAVSRRIGVRRRTSGKLWLGTAAAVVTVIAVAAYVRYNPARVTIADVGLPEKSATIRLADSTIVVAGGVYEEVAQQDGAIVSIVGGQEVHRDAGRQGTTNTITVPRGASALRVRLIDGSALWLGAGSQLKYTIGLPGGRRTVELSGEAFFDVAPDSSRPFTVNTIAQRVTVLGTEFNVSAFPGEAVRTTLVEGSVEVSGGAGRKVTLAPGQQSSLDASSGEISVAEVDTTDATSWVQGVINIDKVPLRRVLDKLSRRYDVDFDATDGEVGDIVLRGSIPGGESLEVVLSALEKASDVEFNMSRNGKITTKRNGVR